MNKLTMAGLSLLATVTAAMPSGAAGTTAGSNDTVFVQVKAQKQGQFYGDSTPAHKDQMAVYHLEFGGTAPFEAATGAGGATGRRRWAPLRFTKALDKASPQFFTAFATSETLQTVQFTIWGPARAADGKPGMGGETLIYTVKLTNAQVASDQVIAPSEKDPASGVAYAGAVEQVSLTFQKIEVTYAAGGITATDSWQ